MNLVPMRNIPSKPPFHTGDILVVFGELFNRGYANGLVEQAIASGMKVIYSTVGRREKDGSLRSLNAQELSEKPAPIINVPLEAGFDLEPSSKGVSPTDQLSDVRLNEWDKTKLDWAQISESREKGQKRFNENVKKYVGELNALIPDGANVVFAHIMAGGVPRAKILMPAMNRVFKGSGDRFIPSENFWNGTDIGKLCQQSFEDVTAYTFQVLLEQTKSLRERIEKSKGTVSYTAYGYHGTEILVNGKYKWQSYSPYVQGWAKIKLEEYATKAWSQGVKATVYNCPEILTNSSSVFQGVEVSLYPLMQALEKEGAASSKVKQTLSQCQELLKPEFSIADIKVILEAYLTNKAITDLLDFNTWPQHSSRYEMELMLNESKNLVEMHKDHKNLITFKLSEVVVDACGYFMLASSIKPQGPVVWIGHDVIAKYWAQ